MYNVIVSFNTAIFNDWIENRLLEENNKANNEFQHLLDITVHTNTSPHSNNHDDGSYHNNGSYHSNSGGNHTNSGSPHSNSGGGHLNLPHDNYPTYHHNSSYGIPIVHTNYTMPHENHPHINNNTPHSNSGGNHNNNTSPHSNSNPHSNSTPHSNSGHSNTSHNNLGFNHENYIPTQPEIFNLKNGDRVKDNILIGLFSYDRNCKSTGSNDFGSIAIKYNLRIRKLRELDGTPNVTSWKNLLTNSTSNSYQLDTKNPFGTGINDGIYELEVWAQNDPRSQNGITKQYVGQSRSIELIITQNLSPEITIKNGDEFINFIFGPDGVIGIDEGFIPYSETLYKEAPEEQQAGIFVLVEMLDGDIDNWQRGWVYLADEAKNEIANTRVEIVWDSGAVAHSSGSKISGYAFISKDRFINKEINLEGAILVVEVRDFKDEACEIAAGNSIIQHTISAVNLRNLSFEIDLVKPTVVTDNKDYAWQNNDISVSLLYADDRSGLRVTEYAITNNVDTPELHEYIIYTGEILVKIDGQFFLHYRAIDRLGNEALGYYGPYKRDTEKPVIIIAEAENGTGPNLYNYVNAIRLKPEIHDNSVVISYYGIATNTDVIPITLTPFNSEDGIYYVGAYEGLNRYYVYIKAVDEAGNEAGVWSQAFNFNNVKPAIEKVDMSLTDGYLQGLVGFELTSSCLINGGLGIDTLTYRIYQKKVGSEEYEVVRESTFDADNILADRQKLFIDFYTVDYQHNDLIQMYFEIEDLAGNRSLYPIEGSYVIQPLMLQVRKEVKSLEINAFGEIRSYNDRLVIGYNTAIELSVMATFVDDTNMNTYTDVTWELSDNSKALLTSTDGNGKVGLLATEVGILNITAIDGITDITVNKEIEITKPLASFAPLSDIKVIYGDTITIAVSAIMEDNTVYNNYPYLVIVASDPSLVSINDDKITAIRIGATTITVTDAFDSTRFVTFELLIKKSPQQRLEDIVIPTNTPVPSFALPELEDGQGYIITVNHLSSGTMVITKEVEGGWVTLEGLQEGNNYGIKFVITDGNDTELADRTIYYTVIDITPPIITGVYILGGRLYVLASDNFKLHNTPYGFKVKASGGTTLLSVQEDAYGSIILVSDNGGSISSINFSASNNINVAPPKSVYIKVIDSYLNDTEIEVQVSQTDQVLYGTVPQDIIDQIYAANNPPEPPISSNVEAQLPPQVVNIIENVLDTNNLTVEVIKTTPNSGTGALQIQAQRYIDELRQTLVNHNLIGQLYYRIDVTEKGLNKLVYTNLVDAITDIIIPGLADSTTYIIRISIVHNGKRLAFRDIEKQTGDATPPVIEKIIISDGTLQVYATDNMKLHDDAYQFQLQVGNAKMSFNPFGMQGINGLKVASLDISSLIAANWNYQAWTSQSRLSGLENGTRVRIIVRDHADNYTMTDIDIKGNGTIYDTVNGSQPLTLKPNQSIELEDILYDLLQNYNQRNPENKVDLKSININDYEIRLSDPAIAYFENGSLFTRGNGQLVITFRHKETREIYKYSVIVTDLVTFDRRIIIQTNSETNIERVFRNVIEREFNEQKITFVNENEELGQLDTEDSIFTAGDKEGLARIIITNGRKKVAVYVIVVKDSFPESNIQLIKTKLAYVLREGEQVNVTDISTFYNEQYSEAHSDYLIIEAADNKIIVEGTFIKAEKEGLSNVYIVDLVTQRIEVIDFKIIPLNATSVRATDIVGHWAEEEISSVLSKGILKDFNTASYSPDEYVTRQDFLNGFSQLKVYLRESAVERRNVLPLGVNSEDTYYYSIMNALNKLTMFEVEYIFGKSPNLTKVTTREEVAALLALDLDLKAKSNSDDYKDISQSQFGEQIQAVHEVGIMKGYEGYFNPQENLTRAEMAVLFDRILKLSKD